jgi:hypothetical protein
MKATLLGTFASLCALAALGCGPTMESPTEIKTLRILGVHKNNPYAVPGEDVTLTMLWHDGSPAGAAVPPRDVHIYWLGGCLNPPGDAYSGCYQQFASAFPNSGDPSAPDGTAPPIELPLGDKTFSVHIPTDAENQGVPVLHPSQDPKLPPYALSYVFFALCAGKLQLHVAPGQEKFPFRCVDDDGRALGPDDFVLGYSAIYSFAPGANGQPYYLNANPMNGGLLFGSEHVTEEGATCSVDHPNDCVGTCGDTGCVNPPLAEPTCGNTPALCIPHCPDDGDPEKCPPHDLRLDIDRSTFEKDQVTNDAYGHDYYEQMWIDYYATAGKFHSATKLLNDASTGYNSANGTQYYAPKATGPVRLWVVTHDNRGGVNWVGTTLTIQ